MRQDIVDELPRFDIARFDKLEQYAFALNQANGLLRSTLPAKGTVQELGNEVALVRDRLHSNAVSLADYRLIDGERLKEIKKANGYRAAATDVVTLRRDHDDAAEIAPTFWGPRGPRKRAADAEEVSEPAHVALDAAADDDDDIPMLTVNNPLGLPITPPLIG